MLSRMHVTARKQDGYLFAQADFFWKPARRHACTHAANKGWVAAFFMMKAVIQDSAQEAHRVYRRSG